MIDSGFLIVIKQPSGRIELVADYEKNLKSYINKVITLF